MTVKDRLLAYIQAKGLRVSVFEKKAGLSNGYIRQLKNSPTAEKIESIISAFPDLDRVWVLSGHGEMFTPKPSQPSQHVQDIHGSDINISAGSISTADGIIDICKKALDENNELRKALVEALRTNQSNTDRLISLLEHK